MAHKLNPISSYGSYFSDVGSESPRVPITGTDNADQASSSSVSQKVGKNGEIEVTSGAGGTSITIGNGATQLIIAQSGHMTLKSSSSAGIVLSATNGTVTIDAPSISLQSAGDLKLGGKSVSIASGGDISIAAPQGDISMNGQKMTQEINGQYTITASRDFGLIVGGNMRQTIAGSTKIGSTGLIEIDTGDYMKIRANAALDFNSGTNLQLYSNKSMQVHSKSQMYISADSLIRLNSENSSIIGTARQTIGLNAQEYLYLYSENNADLSSRSKVRVVSKGEMAIHSGNAMNIRSSDTMKLHSGAGMDLAAAVDLRLSGIGSTEIYGGKLDLDANGEIHMQMNHAQALARDNPETAPVPVGTGITQAPEPAQVETAENINNEISSTLESPDVPTNLGGKGGSGGGSGGGGGGSGGGGGGGNGSATGSSVGRTTNRGAQGSGYTGPSGVASRDGVDGKLMNVYDCAVSKFQQQTGYNVRMISGLRPGDPRFHGKGMALDVEIDNPCGQTLGNYQNEVDDQAFGVYEVFAHQMKQCQEQLYPNMPFRWGGYFWNGGRGSYGAMDTMHFDIGGNSTGGGSWGGGATPQQLNEWGLNSSATQGYTGSPDYSRVPDCGGQKKPSSGSDEWKKAQDPKVQETAKNVNKPNYEKK